MPHIDPTQYLMSALSSLTGGLVSDLQTLILGMVVCTFIAMGADYLFFIINSAFERSARDRNFERAKSARDNNFERAKSTLADRGQYEKGTAEYDRASLQYREYIRKSVKR